mgnify:FL=1|tara:strand:+ start:248 stop:1405 length:1158 start_codon:yes stop_codon:yes gene_type:complete
MSSLLNEAIIDAKALRESALKNAEGAIIDKYSAEVKEALNNLLEQDELEAALGVDTDAAAPELEMPEEPLDAMAEPAAPAEEVTENDIPLAATDDLSNNSGTNLSSLPKSGEEVQVKIDLGALQEAVAQLAGTLEEEELGLNEEDIINILDEEDEVDVDVDPSDDEKKADNKAMSGLANLDEDESSKIDALVDAVIEQLDVDTAATLSGWAGTPTTQLKHEQERELAGEASTETDADAALEEEESDLPQLEINESNVVLENENITLKAQLDKYKHAVDEIKENLYEVNLSNARLLYTNRVLRNTSLNERQKNKIVEAISAAGSVTEARTIFDTLQSTVEAKPQRRPQSLSEAIGHKASVIRATRHESSKPSDAFSDRMRRLAGIK